MIMKNWICRPAVAVASLLTASVIPVHAETAVEKTIRQLSLLTPENVAGKVTLKDDDLEADAVMTTEPVYREKKGLFGDVPDDVFMRAFIDKQTGQVSWQVYVVTTYIGSSWHFYEQANYQTSQGVQTVPLAVIDRQVSACDSLTGCFYVEQVGFDLSDELARALAKLYDPAGSLAIWRFRLKSQGGFDYTDGIAAAEVAGLVRAVDTWKAAHLPVTGATNPSTTTTHPSGATLGVMFVAMPNGAFLARIAPGSRAEKAGLAPGMIVTAVDGKALANMSLAQMQQLLTGAGQRTLTIDGKGNISIP